MAQRRQKVLFVVTKGFFGGAQRYVYDLATNLPKDRFESVVAIGAPGALNEKLHAAGIATFPIQSLQRDIALRREFSALIELIRVFRYEAPDVVHLNSSKAGALGALAGRLAGVRRIVFTAHGWPFAEKRSLVWRILAWLGSYTTALLSHRVICVSRRDLALARSMPFVGHKCILIHNGIDLTMQFGDGEVIRRVFPSGARITGTVGELNRNKNQIALIEAAQKDPSLHIAIVGEGELRSALESKIRAYHLEDRVKLFGFVPAADVLKGFDVFALPSKKEGLPYVLLEAKLAGVPIEAPRIGGIPDILDARIEDFSLDRMIEQTIAQYA